MKSLSDCLSTAGHIDLPTASATAFSCCISWTKRSGFKGTVHRQRQRSLGRVWTSISRPSAPAATDALDMAGTNSQCPVPWLGSIITGR